MGCYESRHAELSDDEEDPEENTLYFKSVFEEREARLGSDHPRTLAAASDLGSGSIDLSHVLRCRRLLAVLLLVRPVPQGFNTILLLLPLLSTHRILRLDFVIRVQLAVFIRVGPCDLVLFICILIDGNLF